MNQKTKKQSVKKVKKGPLKKASKTRTTKNEKKVEKQLTG